MDFLHLQREFKIDAKNMISYETLLFLDMAKNNNSKDKKLGIGRMILRLERNRLEISLGNWRFPSVHLRNGFAVFLTMAGVFDYTLWNS